MANRTCADCGAQNPPLGRFCHSCGVAMVGDIVSQGPPPQPGADAEEDGESQREPLREDLSWDLAYSQERQRHRSERRRVLLIGAAVILFIAVVPGIFVVLLGNGNGDASAPPNGSRACKLLKNFVVDYFVGDLSTDEIRRRLARVNESALTAEPAIRDASAEALAAAELRTDLALLQPLAEMSEACEVIRILITRRPAVQSVKPHSCPIPLR